MKYLLILLSSIYFINLSWFDFSLLLSLSNDSTLSLSCLDLSSEIYFS